MSVLQMARVWQKDVTHPQQSVLLALADHANDAGEQVFPSVAYVAWKTGYDRRQVQRIMLELRGVGVLVQVKAGGGRGRSAHYRIDLSKLPDKPPFRSEEKGDILPPILETAASAQERAAFATEKVTPQPPEPSCNRQGNHHSPESGSGGDGLLPLEPSPTSVPGAVTSDSSPTPPKAPSPSRRARQHSQPGDPRVTPVLARFAQRFTEKTGEPFVPTYKRDGAIIRALPPHFTTEKLEGLVDEYFATADAWVKQHGYDVPTFRSRLNALLAAKRPKTKEQRPESLSERLAREDEERMRGGASA